MSTNDETLPENVASHALAYMRRIDRRMDAMQATMLPIVDILSRQSIKVDRADRDHRENFSRIERELQKIKTDAVLAENRILDRFSETMTLARRARRARRAT